MDQKPHRRRFLKAAAATAALSAVAAPADVAGGEAPTNAAEALAAIVRLRFKYLTEDQRKSVQGGLQRGLLNAEILKRTRLGPTDEPATIFVADVEASVEA